MTVDDHEALRVLYPFLSGIEVPPGWLTVVERLAEQVAEIVPRDWWSDRDRDYGLSLDVREKWGVLRVDTWGAGNAQGVVDRLTEAAEDLSTRACQQPDCVLRGRCLVDGRWIVVACTEHAPPGATKAGKIRRYGFGR